DFGCCSKYALPRALRFAATSTLRLLGARASRIGSVAVRDLWKCASATALAASPATAAIGPGDRGGIWKLVPAVWSDDCMPQTCSICRHPERDDIEAELRAGTPYRDIARQRNVSKDALSRHRANHMSRHTETGLAAAREIMAILDEAETSTTWNLTLLTIREARRYVEELMMLNLTVPASQTVLPDDRA